MSAQNVNVDVMAVEGNGRSSFVRIAIRKDGTEMIVSFETTEDADSFARAILVASCGAKAMNMGRGAK